MFYQFHLFNQTFHYTKGVIPGGAGGAMAPPDFGRSVNPISTKGGRLCPSNNAGTPGFSDLPTALYYKSVRTVTFDFKVTKMG